MNIIIRPTKNESGRLAAEHGAGRIAAALDDRGEANIIVATGASQFEMLDALVRQPDIRWDHVTVFHLDEYVGLPIYHPASFRKYLWERFHSKLPLPVRAFHYLDGEVDAQTEADRVGKLIADRPIDVAFVGIGENGHLAFNDPPADFETEEPYIVVDLDDACRRQQLGEGWFPEFDAVPKQAISMTVRQIMKSGYVFCTVPEERKAEAVRGAVEGPVTNELPASILQEHGGCELYLDEAAASKLDDTTRENADT